MEQPKDFFPALNTRDDPTITRPGQKTLTVQIRFDPIRHPPSRRRRKPLRDPEFSRAGVEFSFRLTDEGDIEPNPIAARLIDLDGFQPSALTRVAWSRWARVAEATARLSQGWSHQLRDDYQHAVDAATRDLGLRTAAKPGRRGHPRWFYESIALQYLQHTNDGKHNPVALIASSENVSRATAAGWIKNCRKLDLLPPARKGRAG